MYNHITDIIAKNTAPALLGLVGILLLVASQTYWRASMPLRSLYRVIRRLSTRNPRPAQTGPASGIIQQIRDLSDCHETASLLIDLIDQDGAGAWPPRANHDCDTWPEPLRAYSRVYHKLETLLPAGSPSLNDEINALRIANFRAKFRGHLSEEVDLNQVRPWLQAAEAGRWDIFPRDTYNAFWCCISMSRHAYRWATIPVVKVAQLERELDFPPELVEPFESLQRHFGCDSQSGNVMSNMVLNFDIAERYIYRANEGFPIILASEEAFNRIMRGVETDSLPIYSNIVCATLAFARHDAAVCAVHMLRITQQLGPLMSQYYDRLHDKTIARALWLSYVQGIHSWGLNHKDSSSGEQTNFYGLSGNQLLAFQVLDAFIGLQSYLSTSDLERVMPVRQRRFCQAIEKHAFRHRLNELGDGTSEAEKTIHHEFDEIVRKLKTFRAAHRKRSLDYLSQPAPERVPMTAGKGVLKPDVDESLKLMDEFMVGRLTQTV